MSLETLQLLRRCLTAQILNVGDPGFVAAAAAATVALAELDEAIAHRD